MMNFFKNKQKISVLASSNNINSTGFSMDEVFDNMGGGRNARGGSQGAGSGGKGITQSTLAGINYSDDWTEDLEFMSSYNFTNAVTKNESKSNQLSFLPTGNILTEADSKTRNENTGNKANFELEYKINPSMQIVFAPKLNLSQSNNNAESSTFSENENGDALNESTAASHTESSNTSFANSINFNKTFEKQSRNLSVVFNNNNTKNDSNGINISETIFYQDNKPNDERNQNAKNESKSDTYSLDVEYTEPVTDSLRLRFGTNFDWQSSMNDQKTFNFDDASQEYSDLNLSLTNYTTSKQNSITPKVGITWQKSKFTLNVNSRTSIVEFDNHSFYLNQTTDLNKRYMLPYGTAQLRYKFNRSKNLTFKYDYSNTLPSATQLMPVADLNNPLNSVVGNPNLNPIEKNTAGIDFKNFDFRTRSGYSLFLKGDYYNNDVVSTSIYDDSGKRNTTYVNISGTYSASIGGNWNQQIKKDAHTIRYGLRLSGNYNFDKGFTNAVLYYAKSVVVTPSVYASYDYGEVLSIAPSYSLSYNETRYENYSRDATSNVIHRINMQTTSYWPANLIFGNDFGYTYNSNISDDFKKDFSFGIRVYLMDF